jgi:hypothetical protein
MKYISRKFIGWLAILVVSTIAMFCHVMSDIVWVSVNLPAFGVFCGFNVWQKKIETEQ